MNNNLDFIVILAFDETTKTLTLDTPDKLELTYEYVGARRTPKVGEIAVVTRLLGVQTQVVVNIMVAEEAVNLSKNYNAFIKPSFINTNSLIVTKNPVSQMVADGETLTLETEAYNFDNCQWFKDAVFLTGETDPTLIIDPYSASDSGQYFCRFFDVEGNSTDTEIANISTQTGGF